MSKPPSGNEQRRNKSDIQVIRMKLATVRILFTHLSADRANEAKKLETGELNSDHETLMQEILLTEMLHYDSCAQIIEALEKSMI